MRQLWATGLPKKEAPLSEYTREEILKLIEDNDGPGGLDFRGRQSDQAVVGEFS